MNDDNIVTKTQNRLFEHLMEEMHTNGYSEESRDRLRESFEECQRVEGEVLAERGDASVEEVRRRIPDNEWLSLVSSIHQQ